MKKFYLKLSGEEVKIGDVISKKIKFGSNIVEHRVLITKTTLNKLIKEGVIITSPTPVNNVEEKYKTTKSPTPKDFNHCIEILANKFGWKVEKTLNFLTKIYEVYPAAAFSMILREIAIELDKKYEDHIENSPEIFVISMFDGRITKANKAHIKNYRNFAAFRTLEDARDACSIVKVLLKDLFKSGK